MDIDATKDGDVSSDRPTGLLSLLFLKRFCVLSLFLVIHPVTRLNILNAGLFHPCLEARADCMDSVGKIACLAVTGIRESDGKGACSRTYH